MRVLVLLSACVAVALAHGTAKAQPAAITGTGTGAEAVRTEPTLRAGASIAVGERHPRHGGGVGGGLGGGRWGRGFGRGWGRGYGFGRFGGGWVYPGAVEQVVVTQPTDYGYGLGGAGYYGAGYGGIGTTYVQQPPQVVVAQPPQVVVAEQQPPQVVYTQAAPPETAVVPASTFVASAAPAAGGFAAGGFSAAAAPASTTSVSTTTATQPGAGFVATAAAPTVVAAAAPTVVSAPPTVVAAAPSASYVTAESIVPGLQYASPYFFGAGSPVVYSRYLGGPTSWYAFRGGRFGRRFGRGVFGAYPFGYGSGGMIYSTGGGGILGNILGGVTGGIVPPIYVGGRIGGRFGRFGHGRRHLEQQPPTTGAGQGQAQALHAVGDVQSLTSPQVVYTQAAPPETAIVPGSTFVAAAAPAVGDSKSLPTTTIASANPRADIMQLSGGTTGEPAPAPAPAEPQKPQALMSSAAPMMVTAKWDNITPRV